MDLQYGDLRPVVYGPMSLFPSASICLQAVQILLVSIILVVVDISATMGSRGGHRQSSSVLENKMCRSAGQLDKAYCSDPAARRVCTMDA